MDSRIRAVAMTIIGEARGCGFLDMLAVASVIRERVLRPGWWGRGWVSVCKQPWQFTCWQDHNLQVMLNAETRMPDIWDLAVRAADLAVNHLRDRDVAELFGTKEPVTHYHDRSISYPEKAWGENRIIVPTPWDSAFLFYSGIEGIPRRSA